VTVITDPAISDDLITVPIRWCAMEGAPTANGTTVPAGQAFAVGNGTTDAELLGLLRGATQRVWLNGAHLSFRGANVAHYPIIADPEPPSLGGEGKLGDVSINNFAGEVGSAIDECALAMVATGR